MPIDFFKIFPTTDLPTWTSQADGDARRTRRSDCRRSRSVHAPFIRIRIDLLFPRRAIRHASGSGLCSVRGHGLAHRLLHADHVFHCSHLVGHGQAGEQQVGFYSIKMECWWGSNFSFFAELYCSCLGFNALLVSSCQAAPPPVPVSSYDGRVGSAFAPQSKGRGFKPR